MISQLIDIFLHLDKNLIIAIHSYGILIYPLVFIIIFLETGLVVTPFLPGDSLIFAAGTLAGAGLMNLVALLLLLAFAAILGDTANYWIGRYIGTRILRGRYKSSLDKTQKFYEKHGGKTIIIARFMPFIRTFAPFVAGIGRMSYARFIIFNIIGGILWVSLFLFLGFFFGTLSFVKNNFSLVLIAIIIISLIPAAVEIIRSRLKK